jgi:hypothetical protein
VRCNSARSLPVDKWPNSFVSKAEIKIGRRGGEPHVRTCATGLEGAVGFPLAVGWERAARRTRPRRTNETGTNISTDMTLGLRAKQAEKKCKQGNTKFPTHFLPDTDSWADVDVDMGEMERANKPKREAHLPLSSKRQSQHPGAESRRARCSDAAGLRLRRSKARARVGAAIVCDGHGGGGGEENLGSDRVSQMRSEWGSPSMWSSEMREASRSPAEGARDSAARSGGRCRSGACSCSFSRRGSSSRRCSCSCRRATRGTSPTIQTCLQVRSPIFFELNFSPGWCGRLGDSVGLVGAARTLGVRLGQGGRRVDRTGQQLRLRYIRPCDEFVDSVVD